MPIDRNDHDERLARIEEILEQLDRESKRFKDFEPDARAKVVAARLELSDAIADSRRARIALSRRRKARKKTR